jgi:hypothetical protein
MFGAVAIVSPHLQREVPMASIVRFTRKELYEKVWTTPLQKLASEVGVSDVAIAKACRKSGIPLPGRGYWAKRPTRQPKAKLKLSEEDGAKVVEFNTANSKRVLKPRDVPKPPIVEAIVVPATLSKPHPLVAATREDARHSKQKTPLSLGYTQSLHVRVSLEMLDRALRILDTMIKASEALGMRWELDGKGKTVVHCDGESLRVFVTEPLRKHELERAKRSELWGPDYEWRSTGILCFRVDEYTDDPCRKKWIDSPKRKIEDHIREILGAFHVIAAAVRLRRERFDAMWRKQEEDERRRVAAVREAERLRLQRKQLVAHMREWEHAERLRAFCDQAEQQWRASGAMSEERANWLAWARDQIELLDPIASDADGVIGTQVNVPDGFKGYPTYGKRPADLWVRAAASNLEEE